VSFESFFHDNHGLKWLKKTYAKEATKANFYSRYSCLKLLLIDVITIWFSDEMLFTLTTLKKIGEWRLVQQKIKR